MGRKWAGGHSGWLEVGWSASGGPRKGRGSLLLAVRDLGAPIVARCGLGCLRWPGSGAGVPPAGQRRAEGVYFWLYVGQWCFVGRQWARIASCWAELGQGTSGGQDVGWGHLWWAGSGPGMLRWAGSGTGTPPVGWNWARGASCGEELGRGTHGGSDVGWGIYSVP